MLDLGSWILEFGEGLGVGGDVCFVVSLTCDSRHRKAARSAGYSAFMLCGAVLGPEGGETSMNTTRVTTTGH